MVPIPAQAGHPDADNVEEETVLIDKQTQQVKLKVHLFIALMHRSESSGFVCTQLCCTPVNLLITLMYHTIQENELKHDFYTYFLSRFNSWF